MPMPRCLRKLRAAISGRKDEGKNATMLLEPSAKANGKQKAGQTLYKTMTLYRPVVWENNTAPKFAPVGARIALDSGRIISVAPSSPADKCVHSPHAFSPPLLFSFPISHALPSFVSLSGPAYSASTNFSTSTARASSRSRSPRPGGVAWR